MELNVTLGRNLNGNEALRDRGVSILPANL